ncbi:MAG TPA: DNA internalization-related competence protein ComEC/Rec2 [Casimicrobiaceae bacterium]|nr:DNA internalization-related competence protein ComEC/Rec2 [Casimicrobiaceae bacterium]
MPSLLFCLVAFAVGVGLLQGQASLPDPPWAPLVVAVLLPLAWREVGKGSLRHGDGVVLAIAAVLAGFGYAAWRADVRLADALGDPWEGTDLVLTGVVDDLPRHAERGVRFAFRVEQVDPPAARVPRRVLLSWHLASPQQSEAEAPVVRAGERWSLNVRLRKPHGYVNRGGFDLEAWMLERNLRASGYVRTSDANRRVDAFAGAPLDHVTRAREQIRDAALAALPDERHADVLVALASGDQSGIDDAAWRIFNRTGVGHLISISGLHVTVFAMLVGGFAFALARRWTSLTSRVPARKIAATAGLAASCAYVLLAGAEIPAQRTLMMLAASAIGLAIGRPGSGLVVWTWALVAVLLLDPWAVLAVGFWLSFFAVGLLIYVASGRLLAPDRNRWRRTMREFMGAAQGQWAITVGLAPLSLALFQQMSLIGPLANAIAIPVVTFAIVPVTLAAALLPFELPWRLAHAMLDPLIALLTAFSSWPGAAWAQHEPPRWAVVTGIVGALVALAPRGVPGRALGAVALLPLLLARPPPPGPGAFRLTALDVGQGTAIVVETHAHALLYDTGPRWHESADAGSRIVVPYLRASGVRALDVMVVSHRDIDHSGGALSVLDVVPTGLVVSSIEEDHAIVVRQAERGSTLRCRHGQRWVWDGVRFEILFPEAAHYDDRWRKSNDLSCVLRIEAAGGTALLAGDIEAASEIDLVTSSREALAADVVLVPHHGSRTSSTSSFIDAVRPRHAVFTVGYRNRFNHPRADVVARYVAARAALHRTDRSGALTFEFPASGPLRVQKQRVVSPRYWHTRPLAEAAGG